MDGLESAFNLSREFLEDGREFLLVEMIGRFGSDGDRGPLLPSRFQPDGAEVGVLDGPPVGLDGSDRHAEGDLVALPWDDNRGDAPLRAGVLLDRARDDLWGSADGEGDRVSHASFVHAGAGTTCYTGPVVEPVGAGSLTSARRRVKGTSPLIAPIKKTRVAEEIAEVIRVLILDGTFPPDQPLPSERTLAERFGVSRGSIRDAFRTLETIGLLVTRHGQGTFPRELDVERLVAPLASVLSYRHDLQDELMDVRRMFEPAVARVAAARITDADLADLDRILDVQRKKLKTGRSAIVEDTAFHEILARATRNRVVINIMATLNDLLVESRKLTLKQTGRPGRSLLGHEAVVEALRRRDPAAAAEAMRDHIDQIADLLEQTSKNG